MSGERLHMLDSNIMSALMEPAHSLRRAACQRHLDALRGGVAISVIVDAETRAGFEKQPSVRKELRYRELMRRIHVEHLHAGLCFVDIYAYEKARLEAKGRPLSDLDMVIVAHAIALNATLVSNDRAFARVERLMLQNWLLPPAAALAVAPAFAPDAARPSRSHPPGAAEPRARYGARTGWATPPRPAHPAAWSTAPAGTAYRVR